jgi:hypothetical protein
MLPVLISLSVLAEKLFFGYFNSKLLRRWKVLATLTCHLGSTADFLFVVEL